MEYDKLSLSIEQQVQLLLDRGMVGDPDEMAQKLSLVSYYRLSAYWSIFRCEGDDIDCFIKGTRFSDIWNLYVFDRKLRLLVMDAIERIEVAVRSRLAYHHSRAYGPFGYAVNPNSLCCSPQERQDLFSHITASINESDAVFMRHFRTKYGNCHDLPPIWMTVEVISFGSLVTLYHCLPNTIKQQISREYGVAEEVFFSWLNALKWVRNACAHHARLWNARLTRRPMIPRARKFPIWHNPTSIVNSNMYGILSICKYSLDMLSPASDWQRQIRLLLDQQPITILSSMGCPKEWYTHTVWSVTHNRKFR